VSRTRHALALALVLSLPANACGEDDNTRVDSAELSGSLTVLAASSLTDAFEQLGKRFEEQHDGATVEFNFAASSTLAQQIQQGAPADVFASADTSTMQQVVDSGDVAGRPAVFARNRLAIAVEEGNPEAIAGLEDLDQPGLVVVLCAEQVPCGSYADQALAEAGVTVNVASREENAGATLSRVELGEADAAVVYATDVEANGSAEGVAIPDADNVIAAYPIATLDASGNADAADAFVKFVRSPRGQNVLGRFGFLAP
jgi:molybdate transport system substrate-binding protein